MEIARNKLIAKDKMMAQYSSGDNIPSRSGSSEENKNKNRKKLISAMTEQELVLLPNGSDPVSDNRAINLPGGGDSHIKRAGVLGVPFRF